LTQLIASSCAHHDRSSINGAGAAAVDDDHWRVGQLRVDLVSGLVGGLGVVLFGHVGEAVADWVRYSLDVAQEPAPNLECTECKYNCHDVEFCEGARERENVGKLEEA
jgi:hypothetical protein